MTEKKYAEKLFGDIYSILLDSNSDLSEEIIISILSKKLALLTVNKIIKAKPIANGLEYYIEVENELNNI